METLKKACIFIDSFKDALQCKNQKQLFFASHCHRDHVPTDMKHFSYPVYCSKLSCQMLELVSCIELESETWHRIANMQVYSFNTEHCPGSMAFFFKKWGILFLGDTRITPRILRIIRMLKPNTILYDNTHEHLTNLQPSIDTSAILLKQVIDQTMETNDIVHVCLPHIGALLLLQTLDIKIQLDKNTLKKDVIKMIHLLDLEDSHSPIMGVGFKHTHIDIMPSSMYFLIFKKDPTKVIQDGHMIRIFASFHLGHAELNLLSDYHLESLHYSVPQLHNSKKKRIRKKKKHIEKNIA